MARQRRTTGPTPVDSHRHKDKRLNIPTSELRDFVAEDEKEPKTVLYPRDPSLDPQLVWKGKDEQDREDLEVPAVPVYIQEKIHPQALVENLRETAKAGEREPELTLFDDFNGLDAFEKKIEFYQHEQNWANRMILGDSLLVMTSLAEKEGLKGKVQMIYMDPPYGIKFGSNWQVSTRRRDVKDGKVEDATREPEQIRAFRDTWKLGIHSYLAYWRDRLVVARDLLTETGSIFVQIGDENVHLVRCVLDEVFGSGNHIATIVFQKTGSLAGDYVQRINDYIVWYGKDAELTKFRAIFSEREEREAQDFSPDPLTSKGETPGSTFSLSLQGRRFHPGVGSHWKTNTTGMDRLIKADRILAQKDQIRFKRYWQDFPVKPVSNLWTGFGGQSDMVYVVQTNTGIVERCLLMTTDPGDLVLDPTCVGKGTRVVTPLDPPASGGTVGCASGGKEGPEGRGKEGSGSWGTVGCASGGKDGSASGDRDAGGGGGVPSPFTGRDRVGSAASPLAGRARVGFVPIEDLRPGDYVYAHDGLPHRVRRTIKRRHAGTMIGLRVEGTEAALWLTEDHLVLSTRRVQALSEGGEWSAVPASHFERARELRRELSEPERVLWRQLRSEQMGTKFRRQHPIGPYIADFYSRQAGLVVEVDGNSHFADESAQAHDAARNRYMEGLGLRVLRYTTAEVTRNLSGVLESIFAASQEQVTGEAPERQWRYAGDLAEGDTVFRGLDLRPGRILAIQREQAVEEVYDLEVEGAHSFLTEVCAVHNCGSGTTAYVAEQWGRRWITIDTSRVALALARTRLMSARYPYFLLADSAEGMVKEAEAIGHVPPSPPPPTEADIRKGFVYKRVPHITLKSIANNEETDEIHARWQQQLEPIRTRLNERLGQQWEQWEVPREADGSWPEEAAKLHQEWWKLRRERQREIDESIARHADTELLYDQPYEDGKRIRVSGAFTVESLSPHRVLATDEERPASEREAQAEPGPGQFETMIIENLRKGGVQNTVKQERLTFDRLESFPGAYIQADGGYTEADRSRRVAVCIGPEHGTVGPDLVKEAAKEALQGVGFDLLLVCGFAFDPHAGEAAKEFRPQTMKAGDFAVVQDERKYGKLPVLLVRINADLSLGEPFLKRTGAGNLFMVFGEPDLELRKDGDGKLVVEVKGVDVYDPTTGEIRSHTTDDIACWFIDTNYDGESFFVRHAYFTGADEPYEKLQRALKAEIVEAAWASLYSTTSRPFDPPATGKIAVKVINHYGDEVLKVYEVEGGATK